mmetsp:Transcript_9813/g.12431  ORF Transcript_9813/g.12431 Transcript_9813/m.12431 type:complete len:190 (-) Transcript_9813:1119-1688(-)
MLNNISRSLLRQVSKPNSSLPRVSAYKFQQAAWFGTAEKQGSVMNAWEKSCYHEMDYTISEDASVYNAVEKFSGYDVGALVAVDSEGKLAGIISERDYIKKVSLLGKTSKETKIKAIFTQGANVVCATVDDSIETAMDKMMTKSIRHLPIMEGEKLVGFVSIKDIIKEVVKEKEETLRSLSDTVFGKSL